MHQPRSTAGNGVSMIFSSVSWDGSPKTQSKGKFPTTRQHAPSPGGTHLKQDQTKKTPISAPVSLSPTPKPAGSALSCQAKLNLVRCSRLGRKRILFCSVYTCRSQPGPTPRLREGRVQKLVLEKLLTRVTLGHTNTCACQLS